MHRALAAVAALTLVALASPADAATIPSPYKVQGSLIQIEPTPGSDALWTVKAVTNFRLVRFEPGTGWTPYQVPGLVTDLALASMNNGWAVADESLLRWNGTAWTAAHPPALDGDNVFGQVAVTGPNDVWLSGATRVGDRYRPVVWHRDATHWQRQALPLEPGDAIISLLALSPNDVWAAGTREDTGVFTLHWDGTSWDEVPVPTGAFAQNTLTASGPDSVWLMVASATGVNRLLHWDGTSWTAQPRPAQPPGDPAFLDALAGGDLWSVNRENYLLRYDGASWQSTALPQPCQFKRQLVVNDIEVVSEDEIYVVGMCSATYTYTVALRYDGTHWSRV